MDQNDILGFLVSEMEVSIPQTVVQSHYWKHIHQVSYLDLLLSSYLMI